MDAKPRMEFAVDMKCDSCADIVKNALKTRDVEVVMLDVKKQLLVVESQLSFKEILTLIEDTGKRAVLMGYGSNVSSSLGAAVAEISGNNVNGVVRIVQLANNNCLIEGTIDGLTPGKHGLNVHEYGDLSDGCRSCGNHFNPHNFGHGGINSEERHVGDLGNISAQINGRSSFRLLDSRINVWDIIGRSLVVHEKEDDLGSGQNERSKVDGNSGPGIACGIIARSSGLFQNAKRLCTCDGVPLWDEREVPIVGKERTRQKL
ncbi:copper chaperone for superoxide dismutase-like isoform X1 [Clavelina lepadiformis]|uniref:copper chaperone for superoxide dismutase-like isoform X1 n=1 Tax=Clavelina lepadiformis TaxID=159417 RepID=UPI0040422F72